MWWVRPWLTPARRLEYGHYNRLMQELRVEDENAFAHYVRIPPHMFDELLNRISTVIQRRDTHMRPALHAGMKLAMTLRHLATGDQYHTLQCLPMWLQHSGMECAGSLSGHHTGAEG